MGAEVERIDAGIKQESARLIARRRAERIGRRRLEIVKLGHGLGPAPHFGGGGSKLVLHAGKFTEQRAYHAAQLGVAL